MKLALAALALLLAGCTAPSAPLEPAAPAPPPAAPALDFPEFTAQDGTLLALPVVGGTATFTYEVAEGSDWVAATLKWATRGTTLTLLATDPSGAEQGQQRTLAGSSPRSPARLDWWSQHPAPGTWTFTVQGQAALQEPLQLVVHALDHHETGMHLAEQLRVPEGRFAEVNMEMKAGQVVRYRWVAEEPLYFNIHTHRDGQTLNLVEATEAGNETTFTAEEDGGYSLLWAFGEAVAPGGVVPAGERAVQLTYRVDGDYTLHSAVG